MKWNEEDLVYDREMNGRSLVQELEKDHGVIFDDAGKQYWWDTLDESKKYQVKKYEYCRPFQYPVYSYRIREL